MPAPESLERPLAWQRQQISKKPHEDTADDQPDRYPTFAVSRIILCKNIVDYGLKTTDSGRTLMKHQFFGFRGQIRCDCRNNGALSLSLGQSVAVLNCLSLGLDECGPEFSRAADRGKNVVCDTDDTDRLHHKRNSVKASDDQGGCPVECPHQTGDTKADTGNGQCNRNRVTREPSRVHPQKDRSIKGWGGTPPALRVPGWHRRCPSIHVWGSERTPPEKRMGARHGRSSTRVEGPEAASQTQQRRHPTARHQSSSDCPTQLAVRLRLASADARVVAHVE